MEIIKILRKNMPLFIRRMRVGELDKTKCSTKFLSHNLNDDVVVNVKCYEDGTLDLRGKKEEYRIIVADTSSYLPLILMPANKLEASDVFLWRSGMTGKYEIHTFHSDAGYGAKTFTNYNEKDGSSMIVNYSGICGVLICNNN